jgi:cell division septum initiation protein DivIVA
MQSLAEERASSVKNRLSGYYTTLDETDQIIRAASGLRDRVQAAGGASSPATGASLALATLQARLASLGAQTEGAHVDLSRDVPRNRDATSPPSGPPSGTTNVERPSSAERVPNTDYSPRATTSPQLQLQLNADALARADADPQALLASINSLIASTQSQQNDLRQAIDTLSQQIASGTTQDGSSLDATIAQLATELATLQATYHQQTFQRDVLTQNVEQARSTRSTLEAKLSEASVAAEAGGDGAIVASGTNATASQSWPPSLSRSLPLALVAGLLIGIMVALIIGRGRPRPSASERSIDTVAPAAVTAAR